MEALGFRLARRGRSALDLRSSDSEAQAEEEDDEDERAESWAGLEWVTGGMAGTGSEAGWLLSMQVALAMTRMVEESCSFNLLVYVDGAGS